jgi:hypothetical protein
MEVAPLPVALLRFAGRQDVVGPLDVVLTPGAVDALDAHEVQQSLGPRPLLCLSCQRRLGPLALRLLPCERGLGAFALLRLALARFLGRPLLLLGVRQGLAQPAVQVAHLGIEEQGHAASQKNQ